ncbi:MAG: hypothetical protein JW795_00040 [Chitinivibrionales bacterium]|nr:hypothetical protein [Chitinivibrionales bacterium]
MKQKKKDGAATIVGGRPPEKQISMFGFPKGIEVLLKKAAVDTEFKKRLLSTRAAAADAIGLQLEPAEINILNAIPQTHLEAVISKTVVEPKSHHIFLGKAAALMIAALSTSTVLECQQAKTPEKSGEVRTVQQVVQNQQPMAIESTSTPIMDEMMILQKKRDSLVSEMRKLNPLFGTKGSRPSKPSARENELSCAIDSIYQKMAQVYRKNTPLPNRTRGSQPDKP